MRSIDTPKKQEIFFQVVWEYEIMNNPVMKYTDDEGRIFELRPMPPYNKDNTACQGCALGIVEHRSVVARSTLAYQLNLGPSNKPLLKGLHIWVQVWEQTDLF